MIDSGSDLLAKAFSLHLALSIFFSLPPQIELLAYDMSHVLRENVMSGSRA